MVTLLFTLSSLIDAAREPCYTRAQGGSLSGAGDSMHWRAAAPRPTGSRSTTEHGPRLLWPIALARHIAEQVAPSPGFTILTFGATVLALLSFGLVMRADEWIVWRSAWQPIWPGIDGW